MKSKMVGGEKVKDPTSQELEGSSVWMVKNQELRCALEKVAVSWEPILSRKEAPCQGFLPYLPGA